MNYIIKNARVLNPAKNEDYVGDLYVKDGKISAEIPENAEVIEASGLVVAPGLVDMHVHLRDPGLTHKEDIISGCNAAAAGGITSLLCMPNTLPTIDNEETVRYINEKAKEAKAKVYIAAALSKGLDAEELTDIKALSKMGVKAFTDDGKPLENTAMLREAMIKANEENSIIVSHCEDMFLAEGGKMNEGEVSKKLGLKGIPNAAEDCDTARTIALAKSLNVPFHICHVSTKNSAEFIRAAKNEGYKISGETAAHYLLLTDKELMKKDADYRMNPPLRSEEDRLAIVNAVIDGTLEVIATDHAPHSVEEKSDFINAPNGAIGMESSLSGVITALEEKIGLSKIIELMSVNPAKILGIDAGVIEVGKDADLVIFDPLETYEVDENKLHGKSKNAVLKGMTLRGKVKYTFLNGKIVYSHS